MISDFQHLYLYIEQINWKEYNGNTNWSSDMKCIPRILQKIQIAESGE